MGANAAAERADGLRIWLLGGFRVALGPRMVEAEQWRRRKVAVLLKLLALAGGQVHRDQLQEQLWPELPLEAAANNLYQALHAARRAHDPSGATATLLLRLQSDLVSLSPDAPPWIDVVATSACALGRPEAAARLLGAASSPSFGPRWGRPASPAPGRRAASSTSTPRSRRPGNGRREIAAKYRLRTG